VGKICDFWVKKHYSSCLSFKNFVEKTMKHMNKKWVHNEKKQHKMNWKFLFAKLQNNHNKKTTKEKIEQKQ
jgi:hypothetical protein